MYLQCDWNITLPYRRFCSIRSLFIPISVLNVTYSTTIWYFSLSIDDSLNATRARALLSIQRLLSLSLTTDSQILLYGLLLHDVQRIRARESDEHSMLGATTHANSRSWIHTEIAQYNVIKWDLLALCVIVIARSVHDSSYFANMRAYANAYTHTVFLALTRYNFHCEYVYLSCLLHLSSHLVDMEMRKMK